jgi:DNA-binding FadR family transcriptional regulator
MSAEKIAADIIDRIQDGEYEQGSRLPTYRELAVLYSVSESTIANVIVRLKVAGWVEGSQGRAVFVAYQDDEG